MNSYNMKNDLSNVINDIIIFVRNVRDKFEERNKENLLFEKYMEDKPMKFEETLKILHSKLEIVKETKMKFVIIGGANSYLVKFILEEYVFPPDTYGSCFTWNIIIYKSGEFKLESESEDKVLGIRDCYMDADALVLLLDEETNNDYENMFSTALKETYSDPNVYLITDINCNKDLSNEYESNLWNLCKKKKFDVYKERISLKEVPRTTQSPEKIKLIKKLRKNLNKNVLKIYRKINLDETIKITEEVSSLLSSFSMATRTKMTVQLEKYSEDLFNNILNHSKRLSASFLKIMAMEILQVIVNKHRKETEMKFIEICSNVLSQELNKLKNKKESSVKCEACKTMKKGTYIQGQLENLALSVFNGERKTKNYKLVEDLFNDFSNQMKNNIKIDIKEQEEMFRTVLEISKQLSEQLSEHFVRKIKNLKNEFAESVKKAHFPLQTDQINKYLTESVDFNKISQPYEDSIKFHIDSMCEDIRSSIFGVNPKETSKEMSSKIEMDINIIMSVLGKRADLNQKGDERENELTTKIFDVMKNNFFSFIEIQLKQTRSTTEDALEKCLTKCFNDQLGIMDLVKKVNEKNTEGIISLLEDC